MPFEWTIVSTLITAQFTLQWLVICMNSQMFHNVAFLAKSSVTFDPGTHIRVIVDVPVDLSCVFLHGGAMLEELLAVCTLKGTMAGPQALETQKATHQMHSSCGQEQLGDHFGSSMKVCTWLQISRPSDNWGRMWLWVEFITFSREQTWGASEVSYGCDSDSHRACSVWVWRWCASWGGSSYCVCSWRPYHSPATRTQTAYTCHHCEPPSHASLAHLQTDILEHSMCMCRRARTASVHLAYRNLKGSQAPGIRVHWSKETATDTGQQI